METGIDPASAGAPILAALAAPLLGGLINRAKAFFAGRSGPPVLQSYYDLAKLSRKGAVYGATTSWVFRAGPLAQMACAAAALALVPIGDHPALLSFQGDFICLAGLLALMRFALILAAMDTGSSFEGMGASREAAFSALAEPAFLVSLAVLARITGGLSLSEIFLRLGTSPAGATAPVLTLVTLSLLGVLLAESARMPVDDPDTHLELTMIHEVMTLDHGGPDLAFIHYAVALKLWVLCAMVVNTALSGPSSAWVFAAGMAALALAIGAVESSMARLRLRRVPQLLIGAGALSVLALILIMGV